MDKTIQIGSKTYRYTVFWQDNTIRTNMSDPCSKCDIGRGNKICEQIQCITEDNFYYLKEVK